MPKKRDGAKAACPRTQLGGGGGFGGTATTRIWGAAALTVITGYVDTLADDPDVDPLWRGPLEEMLGNFSHVG